MQSQFETMGLQAAPTGLDADFVNVQVLDAGFQPSNILERDEPFNLRVQWRTEGNISALLDGTYTVTVFAEGIGNIFEDTIAGPTDVPAQGVDPSNYNVTLNVPANRIQNDGVYRLAVTITYRNLANVQQKFAGFYDGPMLQFYTVP